MTKIELNSSGPDGKISIIYETELSVDLDQLNALYIAFLKAMTYHISDIEEKLEG